MSRRRATSEPSVLRRALTVAPAVRVTLAGGSMGPLIASGAQAIVLRCGLGELCVADVAVYERGERIVAHLVARVDRGGVHPASLRGAPDAPIRADELLGRLDGLVVRRRTVPMPRVLARGIVAAARWGIRRVRPAEGTDRPEERLRTR